MKFNNPKHLFLLIFLLKNVFDIIHKRYDLFQVQVLSCSTFLVLGVAPLSVSFPGNTWKLRVPTTQRSMVATAISTPFYSDIQRFYCGFLFCDSIINYGFLHSRSIVPCIFMDAFMSKKNELFKTIPID